MAVSFKELGGSPVENFGPEGMTCERRFLVEWADRRAFVAELLGDNFDFGGTGLADYPGTTGIKAVRVRCESFTDKPDHQGAFDDVASDLNTYTSEDASGWDNPCSVTVNYEVLIPTQRDDFPEPEDGTFLTYRMDFGGKYVEAPTPACIWESNPLIEVPPSQAIGQTIRIPIIEHHLTWHRVVNPPWQAISDQVGTINNAAFGPSAVGQALFEGCSADKEFTWLGNFLAPQLGWRLSYVFRELRIKMHNPVAQADNYGWNHTFRFNGPNPGWDRLLANNRAAYQETDFATLFKFAATN